MTDQLRRKPREWPKDPPDYVFLARGFDEIGSAMFGEKWSQKEEKPRQDLAPAPVDLDSDDLASTEAEQEHETMWIAIKDEIVNRCLKGDLVSAVRAIDGGAMAELKSAMWNAENLDWRFRRCQMSLRSPFEQPRFGGTHWIFLSRDSLNNFLATQPHGSIRNEMPSYLSPYLKLALQVTKVLKVTPDNQPKKEVVISEIEKRWRFDPSRKLMEAMASLIREPESQAGRAKKK